MARTKEIARISTGWAPGTAPRKKLATKACRKPPPVYGSPSNSQDSESGSEEDHIDDIDKDAESASEEDNVDDIVEETECSPEEDNGNVIAIFPPTSQRVLRSHKALAPGKHLATKEALKRAPAYVSQSNPQDSESAYEEDHVDDIGKDVESASEEDNGDVVATFSTTSQRVLRSHKTLSPGKPTKAARKSAPAYVSLSNSEDSESAYEEDNGDDIGMLSTTSQRILRSHKTLAPSKHLATKGAPKRAPAHVSPGNSEDS